jgi:hypothetical protein
LLQVFVANRVRQIADVKFVAHEGTPLKHNNKSDGVPKAQQIFIRTAVARETDRSPNVCECGHSHPHIMLQLCKKQLTAREGAQLPPIFRLTRPEFQPFCRPVSSCELAGALAPPRVVFGVLTWLSGSMRKTWKRKKSRFINDFQQVCAHTHKPFTLCDIFFAPAVASQLTV